MCLLVAGSRDESDTWRLSESDPFRQSSDSSLTINEISLDCLHSVPSPTFRDGEREKQTA